MCSAFFCAEGFRRKEMILQSARILPPAILLAQARREGSRTSRNGLSAATWGFWARGAALANVRRRRVCGAEKMRWRSFHVRRTHFHGKTST